MDRMSAYEAEDRGSSPRVPTIFGQVAQCSEQRMISPWSVVQIHPCPPFLTVINKSRSHSAVAQLVERLPVKQLVGGSKPPCRANFICSFYSLQDSLVGLERQTHNLEVVGSNPSPASTLRKVG